MRVFTTLAGSLLRERDGGLQRVALGAQTRGVVLERFVDAAPGACVGRHDGFRMSRCAVCRVRAASWAGVM